MIQLHLNDCLDEMKNIPDNSIDAIITDLPYGTTICKWDVVIPFEPMWAEIRRIRKINAPFITTSSQPFTSLLISSNLQEFQDEWVWVKNRGSNFSQVKKHPFKEHESIVVFSEKIETYNPIMQERAKSTRKWAGQIKSHGTQSDHHTMKKIYKKITKLRYPSSVQKFNTQTYPKHPTQKPLELYEYLIKTYTNEGDTVLDIAMGSGTTGEACINLKRNFIGIEKEEKYFNMANERIKSIC